MLWRSYLAWYRVVEEDEIVKCTFSCHVSQFWAGTFKLKTCRLSVITGFLPRYEFLLY